MGSKKEDRLSSLTEDIVLLILSFLPSTKSAATTAVLSRSWRYLWMGTTVVRLTLNNYPKYKSYLERVPSRQIQTVELDSMGLPDMSAIESIANKFGQNVKELKVTFKSFDISSRYWFMILPPILRNKLHLKCFEFVVDAPKLEYLEVLKVHALRWYNVMVKGRLPNLRSLVITLRECNLHSFGTLVRSCPLLEVLRVHVDILMKFENPIEIKSQNLMLLRINLVSDEISLDKKNAILVDAPELKHLELNSSCMVKCCFSSTLGGLVKAKVFMGDGKPRTPRCLSPSEELSIVSPIYHVKNLSLSGEVVMALCNLEHTAKTFDKLSHLEMGLCRTRSWIGVKRFLQFCPNLQSLVLRRNCAKWNDRSWSEIDILPPCLQNKIQSIELWNFDGSECELKLINHIFNVAKYLKQLYVNNGGTRRKMRKKEIKFRQELYNLSNRLPNCHIRCW